MGALLVRKTYSTKCSYITEFYKPYDEIKNEKRGRKSAIANVGLQVGLKGTQISNTGARRILFNKEVKENFLISLQMEIANL